jgi:transcriptional regulator with XRE-family HTH domain
MYSLEPTPIEVSIELAARLKKIRRQVKLSQADLAERSGVSLGSLKRFENSGKISLETLLKLAHLLGKLKDFENLLQVDSDLKDIEKLFTNN